MSSTENQDYGASTQPTQTPSGPEGPQGPSMAEASEESYPDVSQMNLREYDESYIQLGDFEPMDMDPGILEEAYGDADLDGVIYHGDLTRERQFEGEDYFEITEKVYENLNNIGEVLDVDIYIIPGNNDPDGSELLSGRDWEGQETDGRPSEEKLEKFGEYLEGKEYERGEYPHDMFVNSFDNLVDARNSEIGGQLDMIFMGNHFDPELDEQAYKAIYEGPGANELYEEEGLREVASYLEDERSRSYGILERIPLIGNFFESLGSVDIEPDSLSLPEIEEVPDEKMSQPHRSYLEDISDLKDEYSEQIERFDSAVEELSERVQASDNPAIINHSVPWTEENQHGSMVLREVMKRHGDDIRFISGGHTGNAGVRESEGTEVINSEESITEIGLDEGAVEHNLISLGQERQRPNQERIEQTKQRIMDREDVGEEQAEEILQQMMAAQQA